MMAPERTAASSARGMEPALVLPYSSRLWMTLGLGLGSRLGLGWVMNNLVQVLGQV